MERSGSEWTMSEQSDSEFEEYETEEHVFAECSDTHHKKPEQNGKSQKYLRVLMTCPMLEYLMNRIRFTV